MSADRQLLFGILALQNNFISREQLLHGFGAWIADKSRSLGDLLLEQGHLAGDEGRLLDALMAKHLDRHDGNPVRSLAAASSIGAVRKDLEQFGDAEVQACLDAAASVDPVVTLSFDARTPDRRLAGVPSFGGGTPTSAGQRFRVLRPHAEGGLGKVWVALDQELSREVAFKEIKEKHIDDAGSRARFLVEAEITGGLEHPGIVPVYGLGTYADGRPFYAMRFIKGDSLKEAIDAFHRPDGAAPPSSDRGTFHSVAFRKLLGRFVDVCNAIAYAHSRGVLHRDLKPGNVMLGKYGETLVVDWGLAKVVGGTEAPGVVGAETPLLPASARGDLATLAGSALGTPAYMSPEQAAGRLDQLGPATDVYSLGATLYHLLTGKTAFAGKDRTATLSDVQAGNFPAPRRINPHVPAALEAVCLKAMALRPQDRYATPRDLAEDVERWLADEPVRAWPEPITVRAGRWARRNKPLVSGVAAALVVGFGLLTTGLLWYQDDQNRQAIEQAQRDADAARKLALTEQSARQALQQGNKARGELHAELKTKGTRELLNRPERWQAMIDAARSELKRARSVAEGAEGELAEDVTAEMSPLDRQLLSDTADYALALRLEKIRLDASFLVDGKFDLRRTEQEYPKAFGEAGLAVAAGSEVSVARRIADSAIKDQLLAALDFWASVAAIQGQRETAERLLATARQADPHPWRDLARTAYSEKSRADILKLAEETHANPALFARLSPELLDSVAKRLHGHKAECAKWLRASQAAHPTDFWLSFQLANVLLDINKKDPEVSGFYRAALATRPRTGAAWNNLGIALHGQKDLPGAAEAHRKALALDPQNAAAWTNLGIALRDQKDLPGAAEAFRKALALDPQNAIAWNNLGVALRDRKDLPGAAEAHRKALALDPQYAAAWNDLGVVLGEQKDFPGAAEAFRKALALTPQDAVAWYNLGAALRDRKDLPGAAEAHRKALALDPQNAAAWTSLGNILHDQNDLPGAAEAHRKALAIDPEDAIAWNNLGAALLDRKDFPGAAEAFRKALALDPENAAAWTNLGLGLGRQKDFPGAAKAFRKAVAFDPQNAAAWYNLGTALGKQKDLPGAAEAFRKALALNSQDVNAWNNLGATLREQNNLAGAAEACRKALAIDPRYAIAWNNLGAALREQKDLPGAAEAHRKALAIDPEDDFARAGLGATLLDRGEFTAARGELAQCLKALPPGHPLHGFVQPRLQHCERMLTLERTLSGYLDDPAAERSSDQMMALGDLCLRFKQRYRDGAALFAKAFEASPAQAKGRYEDAARAAVLAALGRGIGADDLDDDGRAALRKQANQWLRAEWKIRANKLGVEPASAIQTQADLRRWQEDKDLAGLRDPAALAKLPAGERANWEKLWADVERLRKDAQGRYTETRLTGALTAKERTKVHEVTMSAGVTYVINMESAQFDTFLKLRDADGQQLAENDDISPTDRNSRLTFTPQADGTYRLVATSFQQQGVGTYTLIVREFASKKK